MKSWEADDDGSGLRVWHSQGGGAEECLQVESDQGGEICSVIASHCLELARCQQQEREVKAAAEKAAAEKSSAEKRAAEKAKEAQAKADAEEIKELMGFIQQAKEAEATTPPDVPTALQYYEEAVKWAVGYFERKPQPETKLKPTPETVMSRVKALKKAKIP
eukprot:COSAG04_NODE_16888_length_486_cov_0.416021_1_plen_161_part_11